MRQDSDIATFAVLDRELISRACQGDREAQDAVLRSCVGPLSRFANSLLPISVRSAADVQDVVQDVLANATARLPHISCDGQADLLSYLLRSVRHRVVDVIRRTARRPQTCELLYDVPARGLSPLDAAMRTQERSRLRAALVRLNARDRRALLMRLRQHSYDEIADDVGSPTPNAARVMVRRAADRVAKHIERSSRAQRRIRRYRA